ncbi:hypothetical protein D4764_03G0000070 [Takifugu flavidus]|uniref:Reelin domain-containing protein n=1 Tax=Takifugu flavidus TaxID=433684 RepID=A0A5C6N7X7_9TELE|nr:hypothetical protein D4764_03G0000070 [Takifugu flavidus]
MQPTHHCFLAGAVFLSLVSSTLTFSRGASYASCQDMTPGHISAHPLDPKQNHITLRTSASSYLPGQLLTVTVRSSRDFMGFLLQARSVDITVRWAGVESRTKNRVKDGIQSARFGPILIGGSWILAPPGTQKLHCVSDDDTLTHSDKQLKRNLSFVWKAPDSPMGDFRFYITVVQSYFVHWAGIESPVVHDQSRGSVSGSNITSMDEWKLAPLPGADQQLCFRGPDVVKPIERQGNRPLYNLRAHRDEEQGNPKPPLGSSHDLSSVELRTTSPSSPTSQYITSSSFWTVSPATISPTPSSSGTNDSFISSASSATASTSTPVFSVDSISTTSLVMSSGSTSPHPAPSQVHRRSLSQPFTSTYSSVSSQQLPKDQGLLIQIPTAPSESHQKLSIPSPTMMVHPNPEPYPNFDPHLKANINKIEPNPPNTDTKTEHPTNAARTPGRDGKYPDTIPRHTSWELGMLLGCSAGLGMVLVVGLRYMYSQVCGKRTVVTLNNREREYPRGERGLIHVQECGDLVRVRRIRDNSFVFLAEYDILASPED